MLLVFANLCLSRVGSPKFDAARMNADLEHLDTFYITGGPAMVPRESYNWTTILLRSPFK